MSLTLEEAEAWVHSPQALIVGVVCAAISIVISATHITYHLNNYTMPAIQIYVIRILVICPVYAVSSALALWLGQQGLYAETFRDIYEAFVIYSFLGLILEFCGGETDCIYQIENEPPLRMPCPLCCMKPIPRDARLMRLCQRGVLQFVIIKPVFAVLDIVALAGGFYYYKPYQYFELSIYNVSYTWALYCMFVFYMATNHIIRNFRPVLKFASVKIIVFATYYQSLAIKAVPMPAGDAVVWNDLILCIEMVLFAMMHVLAYPTSEFQGGTPDSGFMDNMKDVLNLTDVMQDMYHNFTPVYHDYGLQRQEKEMTGSVVPSSTGFLSGNLDSVAVEMSSRYRGRNRRFAFNSLLRGDKPIRARLRPIRERTLHEEADSDQNGSDESDIECGAAVAAYPKSSNESIDMNSSHGLLSDNRNSDSEIFEDSLQFVQLNPLIDSELLGTAEIQNVILVEDAVQRKLESRRMEILKMRTHGTGVIITAGGGVTVREAQEFPTEDELLVNGDFLNPDKETDRDRLTLEITKEYRVPLSRYSNISQKRGNISSPTTGDDEDELQQEFEFGMSGLVDADYLRQEYQPFKIGEKKEREMFPDDSDDLLSRYKASPLEKPVKLTSMFTKRKVSISRKEIGLTALQKLAQNSSLASPALKAMESDLASSLMPELLPQQIFNEKKIKRTLGALRPRIECPEGIIDVGKHNQTSWEPLDWDKLHDHVGSNMEWDNAACVLHQDVFEEFQGYDSVPVRKSSEGTINSTDSMDRDRDTTLYDSNSSSHDSSHGFLSDNKRSGGSDRVLLTGNSRSLGSNASFQNPPPRNIVGKGKKKHDREQYDPEEDVDASI